MALDIKDNAFTRAERSLAKKFYDAQNPGNSNSVEDALVWVRLSLPDKFWQEMVNNALSKMAADEELYRYREIARLIKCYPELNDILMKFALLKEYETRDQYRYPVSSFDIKSYSPSYKKTPPW